MSDGYTPPTNEVLEAYMIHRLNSHNVKREDARAEFHRWNAPREEALAATHRVRELATAWAEQSRDYDDDCNDADRQITDGNLILAALSGLSECADHGLTNTISGKDGSHE